MKTPLHLGLRITLLVLIPVAVMLSCKKSDLTPIFGLNALKNGSENWIAQDSYAGVSNSSKIIQLGGGRKINTSNGYYDEWLTLSLSFRSLSELSSIAIKEAEFINLIGGDVVSLSYLLDTTQANNWIRITRIDTTNKYITGVFNLSLKKDPHFSQNKDTLSFTSGQFLLNYKQWP